MCGISKPSRNLFELSVLLNYFLTRYSGSDGKVPGFLFFFSLHARCLASPVSILFPVFHLLPRTVPFWNRKPCQFLGWWQSTDMSSKMERWFGKWLKGPVVQFIGTFPQVRSLGLIDLALSPAILVHQTSEMWVKCVSRRPAPSAVPLEYPLLPDSRPLCPEITERSSHYLCPLSVGKHNVFLKCKSKQVSPGFLKNPLSSSWLLKKLLPAHLPHLILANF